MDIDDERIREAVRHTEILRAPKQGLATLARPISTTTWLLSRFTQSW